MKKQHIVLIQNTEIWGHLALSTFLSGLLQQYRSADHTYELVCGSIVNAQEIGSIPDNIRIHCLSTNYNNIKDNLRFTRRAFQCLRAIHRKQPIDILHCFYPNSSLQAAVLFKLLVHRSVRIVYDVRSPRIEMAFANNWISSSRRRIKRCMHVSERLLVKFVDQFVFLSEGTKTYYQRRYSLSAKIPVSVIPTGVDCQKFAAWAFSATERDKKLARKQQLFGTHILSTTTVIGYIGTISRMRQMVPYLEAHLDELKKADVLFCLIGSGDVVEELQTFINTHQLTPKFFVPGKMPQSALIPYMHAFDYWRCHLPDIFVFSNSFPLKIVEYLAAGIPVLASRLQTHEELAKKHPTIHLYDKSLFATIVDRSNQPPVWEDREQIIRLYDWSSLYVQYLTIYARFIRS